MGLWGAGGGMIIWLAGLKGISESYYEAASLDGAGVWQQFRHITLPLLSPYIFFNLIMGLIGTFQIFTQAYIMTRRTRELDAVLRLPVVQLCVSLPPDGLRRRDGLGAVPLGIRLTVVQLKLQNRWVYYEEG